MDFLLFDILQVVVGLFLSEYDSFARAFLRKLLARGKVNLTRMIVSKKQFTDTIML